MDTNYIDINCKNGIAILTINRPEAMNALNIPTLLELESRFNDLENDPNIKVVIFTGAGNKSFVAGGDIADIDSRQGLQHYQEFGEVIHRVMRRIENSDKPTIGAINGWALGGGVELLLTLDIRIVADHAKLGVPEIGLGLFPGAGGSQRLMRQIPRCRARELMFLGDPISAGEAVSIGLCNCAVPVDQLMVEAGNVAAKLAAKSPITLKLLKRSLRNGEEMPLGAALAYEQAMIGLVLDTRDAHEGCQAFITKRPPQFTGE